MSKKNLNLKKALMPVSEEDLKTATGGVVIINRFGCCVKNGKVGKADSFYSPIHGQVFLSCNGSC